MRKILFLLFIGFVISFTSCRKDFVFEPSKGGLTFSKDTVYLDTVFSNIGSSTYRLKVYNKSNTDISIPKIQLQKGTNSKYRLMVDGLTGDLGAQGKSFTNVELLAKDSLFIFIEVTSDVASANPTDFLYTDKIEFTNTENSPQVVDLVTLIQDAYFLYPKRFADGMTETLPIGEDTIYGFVLDENDPINGNEYIWNNTKPYVIYGYAAVPSGKTLTVQKGARIHFHDGSGLIVGQNGTLKVEGEASATTALENQVIFEGDRLEPNFAETPGQWGAIWLTSGSTNHTIDHLTIKNAIIGLLIENNAGSAMTIKNTQIYNSSNIGVFGKTANIVGENIVVNYGGQASVACTLGGSYDFKHCTFNNNWPSSKQVAVLVDNYFVNENNQQVSFPLAKAEFTNCIIFGSNQKELAINKSTDNLNWTIPIFTKCQIKYNATIENNSIYGFLNDATNIIKNGNPDFEDITENNLQLKENSAAINFGLGIGIPLDILGNTRIGNPDLGAYEFQP
ncbi:MAG: hypothetical protein ACI9XR_000651 [Flavobacterium sp.]|jgi:hypothetical protein